MSPTELHDRMIAAEVDPTYTARARHDITRARQSLTVALRGGDREAIADVHSPAARVAVRVGLIEPSDAPSPRCRVTGTSGGEGMIVRVYDLASSDGPDLVACLYDDGDSEWTRVDRADGGPATRAQEQAAYAAIARHDA